MSTAAFSYDTHSNLEEVFWLYNRTRSSGVTYNFTDEFDLSRGQHGYSHVMPIRAMLTNDFYNIRSGSNKLKYTLHNDTDDTEQTNTITIAAARYDTITELHSAVKTALQTSMTAAADTLESGASCTVAITTTTDYKTKITVTMSGNSDTFTFTLSKADYDFSSTIANDLETALGFVDSNQKFSTGAATLTLTSPKSVDINHIRFVRIRTNIGKQKHGGTIACVPIHGTVLHGFEEVNLLGSHPLYHASPIGRSGSNHVFRIQCTDMNGQQLEGSGHVNIMFKLLRKATLDEYSKRIRMY